MEVRNDGEISERVKALNKEVFETPIDEKEWKKRMTPGNSWAMCTEHGFLLAHERENESSAKDNGKKKDGLLCTSDAADDH